MTSSLVDDRGRELERNWFVAPGWKNLGHTHKGPSISDIIYVMTQGKNITIALLHVMYIECR